MDDTALIAAHLSGDRFALAKLLSRYRLDIKNLCVRYGADLDDVMQECAVRAIEWLQAFDASVGSFGHWIIKVARGFAVKQRRWHLSTMHPYNVWLPSECEDLERPDLRFERAQQRWMLQRAVVRHKRAKPDDAKVVRLRYWDEKSLDVICKRTSQSAKMVTKRLSRSLDSIYGDMGNEGDRPKMTSRLVVVRGDS